MRPPVLVAVFEGGHPPPVDDVDRLFLALRRAAALDLVEAACGIPDAIVVLASDDAALRDEAAGLGAVPHATRRAFHLGRELQRLVHLHRPEAVLVMGGGAGPLLTRDDLAAWCAWLLREPALVLVNNPLSPDVVGIRPAAALLELELPAVDNQLGLALRAAGLPRRLVPNEPRVNVDLDTPADALVLALTGVPGRRLGSLLRRLPWEEALARLRRAVDALLRGGVEVFLAGRVSPVLVSFLNAHVPVRTRVLAEERGMKALGREERGEVRSFLAEWIAGAGVDGFFAAVEATCAAAFIDTRPLFAHGGRRVDVRDRFRSDLGLWEDIADPFVRAFTRRAVEARVPVVLGGHSVVYGGVWWLASIRCATWRAEPEKESLCHSANLVPGQRP